MALYIDKNPSRITYCLLTTQELLRLLTLDAGTFNRVNKQIHNIYSAWYLYDLISKYRQRI